MRRPRSQPGASARPSASVPRASCHQGAPSKAGDASAGRQARYPNAAAATSSNAPTPRTRHRSAGSTSSTSAASGSGRPGLARAGRGAALGRAPTTALSSGTVASGAHFREPGRMTGLSPSTSPCASQVRSAARSMGPISLPSPSLTFQPLIGAPSAPSGRWGIYLFDPVPQALCDRKSRHGLGFCGTSAARTRPYWRWYRWPISTRRPFDWGDSAATGAAGPGRPGSSWGQAPTVRPPSTTSRTWPSAWAVPGASTRTGRSSSGSPCGRPW